MEDVHFPQLVRRGCEIGIHRNIAVATIGGERIATETRSYKTFSSSLTELQEWLIENGVTHVVMESTDAYWKPVYKPLLAGLLKPSYIPPREQREFRDRTSSCRMEP